MKSHYRKPHPTPEVVVAVLASYGGLCAVDGCTAKADDIHHILANTKANNARWPLLLQSPMNLVPLCRSCHAGRKHLWRIPERVADVWERWLEENGKAGRL